ncbi:Putative Cell wall mannoprotein [Septoria linicola]|uniref:Cell wall mannoprotein n=1 Tax=Septoria linicola TaxID=215465 RepID=A0A9Q9EI84_9PEZI|nr:putative Cell wall mannoprotein [Septoria linicola]USW50819.1 Putative Cell wall mannoprotein [Septoria linicola]
MKYATAILATVALATAQDMQYSTIDTIISNVQNITNQTVSLTAIANNLTSLTDAITLNGVSAGVQEAINVSIANAKMLPDPLDPADGIKLIPYIQKLSNASVDAIGSLITHQSFFVNNNIAALVLPSLVLQNATSYDFNSEIAKRNPANLQEGSALLAKPIFDALAAGVTAFTDNGTLCNDIPSCYRVAGVTGDATPNPGNGTTSAGMKNAASYSAVLAAAVGFAAML